MCNGVVGGYSVIIMLWVVPYTRTWLDTIRRCWPWLLPQAWDKVRLWLWL